MPRNSVFLEHCQCSQFETLVNSIRCHVIPTGNPWHWSGVKMVSIWGQTSALLAAEYVLGNLYKTVGNVIYIIIYKKIYWRCNTECLYVLLIFTFTTLSISLYICILSLLVSSCALFNFIPSFFWLKNFIYLAVLALSCGTHILWSSLLYRTLSFGICNLVPWPGIKPRPCALGVQGLSHWTTREVPD